MGTNSYSGSDFGGIYWIMFLMPIVILVAFFVLHQIKKLDLIWTVVAGALGISVAVIIYGCLAIAEGKRILLIKVGPEDVHLRLHTGGFGTILGYLMTSVGAWFANRVGKKTETRA